LVIPIVGDPNTCLHLIEGLEALDTKKERIERRGK